MLRTSGIFFSSSAINNNNNNNNNNRLRLGEKHTASSNRHFFNMSSNNRISRDWSPCITSASLFILLLFTTTTVIIASTSSAHSSLRVHDKPTTANSHKQINQLLKANKLTESSSRELRQFVARSYGPSSDHTKDNLEQPILIDRYTRSPKSLNSDLESIKDGGGDDQPEVGAMSHEQASTMTNSTQITSSMTSALISATTTSSNITEYVTVNYNGVIGVNATDPFAIATESRSFGLPIEIQILMCLLYGTLAFTAVTSNLTVCYIVLSNQRMRTATNYFIVNLAVGDILMALLCIPFTFPANLIFQYWPFGLSLCVIVSYSQANSVFISAYTMVAISIDKYIAIMYPMRLRMPKNQAKMIILVIWSAALITSLPTALLSSLTPATPDLGPSQPAITPSSLVEITTPASVYMNPSLITNSTSRLATTKPYRLSSQAVVNMTSRDMQGEKPSFASSTSASGNSSEANISSSMSISTSAAPTRQEKSQQQQNQEYEEQKKYFCQESWLVWPGGKYYYSMALMILQFVVPLFVLVVTYTRIVIVVWGKRVPGEEDNARDARMARSKRKMIRMVIFCVIAFALTWLPFNSLIVIGDMHPDIWENQNIMYIWFITHYLAMCHTITNPLIYIWMNNRFRAGFTQVVADACRFLRRLFAYLLCHCLCMGCCLDCSRQKYARVEQNINRKRARKGPLASIGSIHANNYHSNNGKSGTTSNQHPHHHYNIRTTTGGNGGGASGGGGHERLSSNDYCTKVTNSGQIMAANNGNTHLDKIKPGHNSTTIFIKTPSGDNQSATTSKPVASTSGTVNAKASRESARTAGRAISSGTELESSHALQSEGDLIAPRQALTIARNDLESGEAMSTSGLQPTMCLKQTRLFSRPKATNDKSDSGGYSYSVSRSCRQQHSTSSPTPICDSDADLNTVDQLQGGSREGPIAACLATSQHRSSATSEKIKRKKRQRKHSHGISLHMTQPYRPSTNPQVVAGSSRAYEGSCAVGSMIAGTMAEHKQPTTSKWRAVVGVRRSKGKQQHAGLSYSAECPSCQSVSLDLLNHAKSRAARKQSADAHVRFQKFMYEFRNSSQSTATISAQTNNTSLALTPLNTATASGTNGESANTSASLSPNGLGSAASGQDGKLSSRGTRRRDSRGGDGNDAQDNSITVLRPEHANGPLSLGTVVQLNRSSGAVEICASEWEDPFARQGAGKTIPSAVDGATAQGDDLKLVHDDAATTVSATDAVEQIEHSIDPSVECVAYQAARQEINVGEQQRQEHLPHKRQSVDGGTIGGGPRLHVGENDAQHNSLSHNHHRDSAGTLSEATSLEGHQLASSTSASDSCNQSDTAHSKRQDFSDENSVVQPSRLKFCPEHRQTVSSAEVNPRGHCNHLRREVSFIPTKATRRGGALVNNESDVDPLDDEHYHNLRHSNGNFCSPLNEIGAQVVGQQEFSRAGRKSSSTFELVSEHLLHVRQLPCADSVIEKQHQHQTRPVLTPGHHQHVYHENLNERCYLNLNGDHESLSSNNDDDDDDDDDYGDEDDSSLEAEYGEIQCDLGYRFAGDFEPTESIPLRPLASNERDDKNPKQVQHRNRLLSSTSDGLCSTHSHDDNRRLNEHCDLRRDSQTSRVTLATCIASANSARILNVEYETGDAGQRGTSNKMDHRSTIINFCDIPNKTQPGINFNSPRMVRKSSLHNGGSGNRRHIYQTNYHQQHTKSMSPIHLGRQGSFIVADNAIKPNGARNF